MFNFSSRFPNMRGMLNSLLAGTRSRESVPNLTFKFHICGLQMPRTQFRNILRTGIFLNIFITNSRDRNSRLLTLSDPILVATQKLSPPVVEQLPTVLVLTNFCSPIHDQISRQFTNFSGIIPNTPQCNLALPQTSGVHEPGTSRFWVRTEAPTERGLKSFP